MMNNRANSDQYWKVVCPLAEIPKRGARVIHTHAGNIAIFRTSVDEIFALDDKCPHRGGPLSQGIVFDKFVACPLHDRVIHLDSGQLRAPDEGCTNRYPVKVERGMVSIALERETAAVVSDLTHSK